MLYDVHAHTLVGSYESDEKILLRASEEYGIDKFFISSLHAIPNPTEEQVQVANAQTLRLKKDHPELIEGYVYVSPEHPNALKMLRTAMEDWGFVGLKVWMSTTCDDHYIDPIVEQMIEYKAPILIHSFHKAVGQLPFETTGEHVARLAERYPESKLLMAHLGGNAYHGLPCIRDYKNVWVDMCFSICRGDELQYALEMLGEDRILFGTDLPGGGQECCGKLNELNVSQEVKDKIAYKNALELFKEVLK